MFAAPYYIQRTLLTLFFHEDLEFIEKKRQLRIMHKLNVIED